MSDLGMLYPLLQLSSHLFGRAFLRALLRTGLTHGLFTTKVRKQQQKPFTLNPWVLYRCSSKRYWYGAHTVLQISLNYNLQKWLLNESNQSSAAAIGIAFTTGMISSLISCPTEMVMTYQGNHGGNILNAFQNMEQRIIASIECYARGKPLPGMEAMSVVCWPSRPFEEEISIPY